MPTVGRNRFYTISRPTVHLISSIFPPQDARPCLSFLWGLLELADLLGSPRLHLFLDHRHHPAQSLLHAGLAPYQGPALCVVMPEVTLSPDELCELMSPRPSGSPLMVRGRMASFSATGLLGCFSVSEASTESKHLPAYLWT
jgi:hypothetical protein